MRPVSIVRFERCYLGAVLVGFVNSTLVLSHVSGDTQLAAANATFGSGFVIATRALSLMLPLLLWYFVARRASAAAKWIITVLFGVGLLVFLIGLRAILNTGLPGVLSIISFVLRAVAVYLLFRPDSNRWFTGRSDLGETFR